MDDVSEETDYVKTFYENQKNPKGAVGAVYRCETVQFFRNSVLMTFFFIEEKDLMT